MAVSDNQYKYLNNMAAGKTSTGGQATSGQSAWAKAQLAKIPAPPATPKPTMTPVTGSVPAPTQTAPAQSAPSTASVPEPPKTPTTFSSPQYNDWMAKQNEAFSNLEKLMATPFQYNPETDPAYQAQRQLAQNRAQAASNSALESMNERGIMGSSLTANQLGQIQQNAEQEALAYIPQYREQAYSQYQNQLANAGNLLSQARALRGDQLNEAQITGNLDNQRTLAGAAQDWGQQMDLTDRLGYIPNGSVGNNSASLAGAQTLAGRQMDLANKKANWDAYMDMVSQTQNLGKGPQSNWGNLTNQAGTGQNTFAANQQEIDNKYRADQTAWENAFKEGEFDFTKAQTAWENAFKDRSFEQDMKEAAASRGLQWASLNQRQKEFVADQAWKERNFAYQQQQDSLSNSNISPYVEEFSKLYVNRDPSTGATSVTNPQALRAAIIGRNLSDDMTDQLMLYYGLPIN